MPEIEASPQQQMLIPVLIGGASMALLSWLPVVNLVNCACCAGIMGGAVLGVFFYKKSYPESMAFGPAQGAKIGALAGVVGALLYAALMMTDFNVNSAEFNAEWDRAMEENAEQFEAQGTSREQVEKVREVLESVIESPLTLFAIVLGLSLIIFAAFGAIGGAIGGKIWKSPGFQTELPPMGGDPPVGGSMGT